MELQEKVSDLDETVGAWAYVGGGGTQAGCAEPPRGAGGGFRVKGREGRRSSDVEEATDYNLGHDLAGNLNNVNVLDFCFAFLPTVHGLVVRIKPIIFCDLHVRPLLSKLLTWCCTILAGEMGNYISAGYRLARVER